MIAPLAFASAASCPPSYKKRVSSPLTTSALVDLRIEPHTIQKHGADDAQAARPDHSSAPHPRPHWRWSADPRCHSHSCAPRDWSAPDPASAPIFFNPRRDGARVTPIVAQLGETEQVIEGSGRREGFIAKQRASADKLDNPYLPPSSPHLLQAGAVIPAALVTTLNSDLPGRVIAQVTAPVYDSVSGDYLLIPQGARLIGTYDSASASGDTRLFLVWNRIIMPNGWSLQLAGMEATDPTGSAGLVDRTDNHLGRLAGAVGLSAVLSVLANQAQTECGAHG